ncbi:MAG TPA: adenine phosphoribosyltransferase [Candidatus Brocadiia bacterium]|nr:adenine phosphoribosyltransferase [Planctomycetota bacterium]
MNSLKQLIRDIPDFPKKGIIFKDITPLLQNPNGLKKITEKISEHYKDKNIDLIAGAEARGFIIGAAVAHKLGIGFIPIRKPGNLPYKTASITYQLEYGTDALEMHKDAVKPGQHILMVDDLLATGGTMAASCRLVESMKGNIVGCAFVIELTFLNGRKALHGYDVFSLIQY